MIFSVARARRAFLKSFFHTLPFHLRELRKQREMETTGGKKLTTLFKTSKVEF